MEKNTPDAIIDDMNNQSLEKSKFIQANIYEQSEMLGDIGLKVAKI